MKLCFFSHFVYRQSIFWSFMGNANKASCVKLSNSMVQCKQYFQFQLRSKIDFRKLLRLLIGSCLTELTFLKEMRMFSRKFNHHWSVGRKRNFSDCLRKQIFGLDSTQHYSNFISFIVCVSSKHFLKLYGKYKEGQLR